MNDEDYLVEELKEKLAESGYLENAKARLRSEILLAMKGEIDLTSKRKYTLKEQAIQYLIFDCLKSYDMHYTLPIYHSEAGLRNEFALEEILDLFGIQKAFLHHMNRSDRQHLPLLYRIVSTIGRAWDGRSKQYRLKDVSTQTSLHNTDFILTTKKIKENLKTKENDPSSQSVDSLANVSGNNLESHLFKFQRECEEREKKLMEEKLEVYKQDFLSRVQIEELNKRQEEISRLKHDMKRDYDRSIHDLQIKFADEKLHMETQNNKEKRSLTKEITALKQKELDNRNDMEIERRKLKLEEQKFKHALKTAEAKLKYIEVKEMELKEGAKLEYQYCRDEAKKSYEEALETIQKQVKLYQEGLDEVNSLRRLSCQNLIRNEQASIEVTELRVQKKSLELELNKINSELGQLRISSERFQDELQRVRRANTSLKQDLKEALEELSNHKAAEKDYRKLQDEKIQETLKILEHSKLENMTVESDNRELRQLLDTMQSALLSFPTQISYDYDFLPRQRQFLDDCPMSSQIFEFNKNPYTDRINSSTSVPTSFRSNSNNSIIKEYTNNLITPKLEEENYDADGIDDMNVIFDGKVDAMVSRCPFQNVLIMSDASSITHNMDIIENKFSTSLEVKKYPEDMMEFSNCSDIIDSTLTNNLLPMNINEGEIEEIKESQPVFNIIESDNEVRLSPVATNAEQNIPTRTITEDTKIYGEDAAYDSSDFESESVSSALNCSKPL